MVISKAQVADNQYGKSVSQIPSTAQTSPKQSVSATYNGRLLISCLKSGQKRDKIVPVELYNQDKGKNKHCK